MTDGEGNPVGTASFRVPVTGTAVFLDCSATGPNPDPALRNNKNYNVVAELQSYEFSGLNRGCGPFVGGAIWCSPKIWFHYYPHVAPWDGQIIQITCAYPKREDQNG